MAKHDDRHEKEHTYIVDKASGNLLDDDSADKLSDFYKVLSDPTRLKILSAIGEEEVCVCCISEILGMSVSAVSHQLKTLRQAHLVKARREGRNIYYSLDDHHVRTLLDTTTEHLKE